MPNYMNYHKSIADEFKSYEKRVRDLIDNTNWGEEGRYKEIILMNYLKRVLPKNYSVGTGFVRKGEKITKQIDIIIYDNRYPLMFAEGDFIVATARNVIGIIEVKSSIQASELGSLIEKANFNGFIIAGGEDVSIFNGIFSYNIKNKIEAYADNLRNFDYNYVIQREHWNQVFSRKLRSCVNHIALGDAHLTKLMLREEKQESGFMTNYSIYNLNEGLGFSYFFSNLQERIAKDSIEGYSMELPEELRLLYDPIPEGKESYIVDKIKIEEYI